MRDQEFAAEIRLLTLAVALTCNVIGIVLGVLGLVICVVFR